MFARSLVIPGKTGSPDGASALTPPFDGLTVKYLTRVAEEIMLSGMHRDVLVRKDSTLNLPAKRKLKVRDGES
jgi:hypothetical protein